MANPLAATVRWILTATLLCGIISVVEAEDEDDKAELKEAIYLKFDPDFIVNLRSDRPRVLMVSIQGMSRETDHLEDAQYHMPAIRHTLLMLLSEQTEDTIRTSADKKRLMDEALTRVQELLVHETGAPILEGVYFTDFVVD